MQLHGMKPAEGIEAPEKSLDELIEVFDKTGKVRQSNLESALDRLSGALKGVSGIEPGGVLKEACQETVLAAREVHQTVDQLNELVRMLLGDLIRITRAVAINEDNSFQQSIKMETLIAGLVDNNLVDPKELEMIYKERILPELQKRFQKANEKVEKTSEID